MERIQHSDGICEKSCPKTSRSPLTHCYLRCLKWSVQWTEPSSHRFSRLVQAERSDIAIWWTWCYIALSPLSPPAESKLSDDESGFSEQSVIFSHGRDIKGSSETRPQTEYSLYANMQLTKTKQVSLACFSKTFAIQIMVSHIYSI